MCCLKGSRSAFCFHSDRIAVEPSKEVRKRQNSSELIDNNIAFSRVAIPPFRKRVFRVSLKPCFVPSSAGLASTSRPPEDVSNSDLRYRLSMIAADSAQRRVMLWLNKFYLNVHICRDGIEISGLGGGADGIPIGF